MQNMAGTPNVRWLMDIYGMFFNFQMSFFSSNSAELRLIRSQRRDVPDF